MKGAVNYEFFSLNAIYVQYANFLFPIILCRSFYFQPKEEKKKQKNSNMICLLCPLFEICICNTFGITHLIMHWIFKLVRESNVKPKLEIMIIQKHFEQTNSRNVLVVMC